MNTTLISSMTTSGMGPSEAGCGRGDYGEGFRDLRGAGSSAESTARTDSVMDNLGAHKPTRIRELVEERGCELVYLPAYSPDYNPIEEAFSKVKNLLRKAAARTREALVEAMGTALSAVTAADARGYFEHAGYRRTAVQLP